MMNAREGMSGNKALYLVSLLCLLCLQLPANTLCRPIKDTSQKNQVAKLGVFPISESEEEETTISKDMV
ncbi:hypothetical protein GALMADRAFT_761009 [Galerina marginata CBS 339.88]|uniref:Uncharacterized protein n=1 Tax=Galerina marginata (strain CBS 339.88) TaxID=685588 RepID=A0A067SP46_GALM3|nr:hypothetical protein GALMADRAFT_761009 [Galerina marginata CBS 339.88]